MRAALPYLRALVATNLKASFALRASFWTQVAFMVLNNLLYFVMWWIFFDRFEEVNGWLVRDMAALYGLVATLFGAVVVFGGGAFDLSRHIVDGDLDAWLVQPRHPLPPMLASRSRASGWGDMASGVFLIVLSGYTHPLAVAGTLVAVACGGIVFLATTVGFQSLVFWAGDLGPLTRNLSEFLVIFAAYPRTVFTGALRLLLYTALPAGFLAYLPVELVRAPSLPVLAATLGGALLYAGLALFVFARGLRRYESGSRFGVHA